MLRDRFHPLVALAGAGTVLVAALGAGTARAQPPTVTSELPAWVAPGGLLVVRGLAGRGELVALRTGSRVVARSRPRADRRFVLRARLGRVGRHTLSVAAASAVRRVGRLAVRPVRLAAVGDVTFGDGVAAVIRRSGPRYPWLRVARPLRRADVAVANLETAVSRRGAPVPGKEFTFRGPPRALRAAARFAGIDVVTVANNHSLDYGRAAFADTLRYARKFGIAPTGGGRNLERARRPRVRVLGGLRLAFLGFSDVRPAGFDAGPDRSGTTPAFSRLVATDVRRASARNDLVLVYFHWGVERRRTPTSRQRALARVALKNGAKVVLGAHPHVLQPRERRGGRGRKLVAWSLGNFVFTGTSPLTRKTGILQVELGRRGVLDTRFRRARIVDSQPRLR